MKTVVLGDLHLTRHTDPRVVDDLVRLMATCGDDRVVFAGDLFDLSADHPGSDPKHALEAAVLSHPAVRSALGTHVDRGGELWFLSGNHDHAVGIPSLAESLRDALMTEGAARANVRSSPWFLRIDGTHIEHGHAYDPDNAPVHPLHVATRSLGVHFVEEFIAPTGAFRYLNANDRTPLELLVSAFRWYGLRGPYVVYRYFFTAFLAMARSGALFDGREEREIGRALEAAFAEEAEVPREIVERLIATQVPPTMMSLPKTFSRIYFDRVSATFALLSGLGAIALGRRRAGATSLAIGAALMSVSWALGHDRYGGTVPQLLNRGASRVREATRADLVVFGHAHHESGGDGYANTGSFAFPGTQAGRPYLVVRDDRAERRYVTAESVSTPG